MAGPATSPRCGVWVPACARLRGDDKGESLPHIFLPRGRTENVFGPSLPIQLSKSAVRLDEFQIGKRRSAPVSALGQGIALIPLSLFRLPRLRGGWRANKAHGPDCSGRESGLRRTMGRETSRPAPCGAPTRHLRLTPQSAIGPHQELCVPGGFLPRPPVGQACVNACPQVPLPIPALKTPHENALDDGSG
jgi:hypothetical protein